MVSPATRSVFPGDTARYVALFSGCSGSEPVSWSVSDAVVASIVATDGSSVLVKALNAGSVSVVAQSVNYPAVRAAGLLSVYQIDAAP